MKIQLPYYYLGAEAYGTGTYSCGTLNNGCPAGTNTSSNAGGSLVNTGYNVIIPIALAAALIIAAAIVLISKFVRKRKSQPNA